jgi:hypothetical protein
MSEARIEQGGDGPKVRRLSDAVRRVRISEAERTDAFADLHDAERARLDMLADDLSGVFGEIPPDDDFFLCQVSGGMPPRLWIDPTTHVIIGRDRRTYRFLKDTRLGRVVIRETADLAAVADAVTDYIAERIVERDRALETDLLLKRMRDAVTMRRSEIADPAGEAQMPEPQPSEANPPSATVVPTETRARGGSVLTAFLLGIAAGVIGLVAFAWFQVPLG